jgi:hypothetical protein
MTRLSCPSCSLRFGAAATATLSMCPDFGRPLLVANSAAETLGYRLHAPADTPPALPIAVEAAMPTDLPPGGRA